MPDIKFFFAPGACSVAPHVLLHEAGLPYEPIQYNYAATEIQFPADYTALNPKRRVPVLVVDGEVITELPAVSTMISQLAPEKQFFGKTPLETVRVYEWLNYLSGTVHTGTYGQMIRPWRWTTDADPKAHERVKDKARERLVENFAIIEDKLQGVYAVGDGLTAVDPFLYILYRWAKTRSGIDLSPYPKYTALVGALEKRESVKTVLAKEGLEALNV
ncbi:glutathione S-transferase family protein [Aspergillus lucknowensis]|uniref:Glutathione S-transferase n=1 Tax=Aspergillus lucknowensis TaxID=176173 RepID=A0ABR4LWP6_9EURO